ncbi:MAG TPA: nitroreductase family deazaflavin-dependent oxidoreductase [Anaerolineae bacterium]|jgi:deazaflavin-dependent oxidoreductase (nitroreductase family)
MSEIDIQAKLKQRQGLKYLNTFMLLVWRLGLGKWINLWPDVGGQIMVITHTGRKSGLKRRVPVNYVIVDGEVYCTAGFGQASDWYRNIKANPKVEVWLPDGWWNGVADEVTDPQKRLTLLRKLMVASGFAARLEGMDPVTITDDELTAEAKDYRVLHIHRTAERTGPEGPGDLQWVWPLATFILFPLVLQLLKPRRR